MTVVCVPDPGAVDLLGAVPDGVQGVVWDGRGEPPELIERTEFWVPKVEDEGDLPPIFAAMPQLKVMQLTSAGVEIITRRSHPEVDAVEVAIVDAFGLSTRINDWEWRWPLNTCYERDAGKLSRVMLERIGRAEAMRPGDYRAALAERARIRGIYADLVSLCDGCVTLTAPGAAPLGLESTGNPIFAVPFSLLGVPAISLPLLREQNLPLGLQVTGFMDGDAAIFAVAAWLVHALGCVDG